MFPTVMIVANVATVGVLWFGGHRVENGHMEVGALTAYISYLMQIVMSVMMAMFMLMMVPRASVCADRITEVLDTDSSVVPPAAPGDRPARARRPPASTASPSPTPAPTSPCCASVSLTAAPGRDRRDRRLDRRRQVDAGQPGAAALRRHRRRRPGRRRRRARPRPRGALVAARPGAAEGLPLPRDRRRQPALRQARRHRGRDVGGPRDRPGQGLRRGDARRARRPTIAQGGSQPQRRPAPADGDRPGGHPQARRLPLRRLVLRARPHHRRPAARRAQTGDPRRDGGDRGATRRDDPRTPTGSS